MDLVPVLYQAPRAGGAATLQVSALMPSEEQGFYQIAGARALATSCSGSTSGTNAKVSRRARALPRGVLFAHCSGSCRSSVAI
jgi:hypothetical protein